MYVNKEALAVTLLAMFTVAIFAFIVLVSNESLSVNGAASSPSESPPSSRVFMDDPDALEGNDMKKTNSSLVLAVTKSRTLFIIGDSSVDCGENTLFYPLLRHNLSMFPCSNGSDSTLVPHLIAKKMGLSPISSFYTQNGTIEGIMNGLNYGSAGATILPSPNGPSFQSLNQQLRQAFETIQLLQLQLGENEASHLIKSSVFYVSLGKEDYINFLFHSSTFIPNFNTTAQAFWQLLVDEMTNALRNLYDAGARKIVSIGILPLGCAPRAAVEWYFHFGRNRRMRPCVNEINQLIMQYNKRLNERVIALNTEATDAQFVFCDSYNGIMQIMANPQRYGFKDARGACCGRGWRGAAVGCQTMAMACSNMSSHVWWDFYNPTEAVNSLLAESTWSGHPLEDLCRPLSIQALADPPQHL